MLFVDLVEKCLEPWYTSNWCRADLSIFLSAYTLSALEMDALRYIYIEALYVEF